MEIVLRSPLDMHVHLRQGPLLRSLVKHTADQFVGAMAMPNTVPPIQTGEDAQRYREEIAKAAGEAGWGGSFVPYVALYLTPKTTKAELAAAKPHILAAKLYPANVTTNSGEGVKPDSEHMERLLDWLEELDIPLSVHAETPGLPALEREESFVFEYLYHWSAAHPKLRIIMEHVSDANPAIGLLEDRANVFATVTPHHLLLCLDDVIGDGLRPHNYCKPIPKRKEDGDALMRMIAQSGFIDGEPRLMLGTDSAPHVREKKECCCGAAGCFTAPWALPLLLEAWERRWRLITGDAEAATAQQALQAFCSDNARRIYRLTDVPERMVRLVKWPVVIPTMYGEIVPFMAGETLQWRVAE